MTDNWDSYLCEVDGRPASILVDLGAVAHAPAPDFPCLGYVTITLRDPDENGFPRREEFEALSALEDALEASLTANRAAVHIGRCITDGRYELVFYTTGVEDWNSRVAAAMESLPSYEWEAGAHYEPDWDSYLGFLFPGEQDLLIIQNRRLCRQLEEQGDSLDKPRLITHWLDFSGAEAGRAFCRAALERGFQVEEGGMIADDPAQAGFAALSGDGPDGLPGDLSDGGPGSARLAFNRLDARPPVFQARISRMDAPEHIDDVSFDLLDLALEHGGEYRGWSCPIVA